MNLSQCGFIPNNPHLSSTQLYYKMIFPLLSINLNSEGKNNKSDMTHVILIQNVTVS